MAGFRPRLPYIVREWGCAQDLDRRSTHFSMADGVTSNARPPEMRVEEGAAADRGCMFSQASTRPTRACKAQELYAIFLVLV